MRIRLKFKSNKKTLKEITTDELEKKKMRAFFGDKSVRLNPEEVDEEHLKHMAFFGDIGAKRKLEQLKRKAPMQNLTMLANRLIMSWNQRDNFSNELYNIFYPPEIYKSIPEILKTAHNLDPNFEIIECTYNFLKIKRKEYESDEHKKIFEYITNDMIQRDLKNIIEANKPTLKEETSKPASIISRLQKLDNWNMSKNTVRFADLFKELFRQEEYKFIPNAIKKLGNPAIAGQILFYVGKTLGKKMCITLYNIASESTGMKQLLDKRGLDRAIYDDNWYINELEEIKHWANPEMVRIAKMENDDNSEDRTARNALKRDVERKSSHKYDIRNLKEKVYYFWTNRYGFHFLFNRLFDKDDYKFLPYAIEKLGNRITGPVLAYELLFHYRTKFDSKTINKLINIAKRDTEMSAFMEREGIINR